VYFSESSTAGEVSSLRYLKMSCMLCASWEQSSNGCQMNIEKCKYMKIVN